jgi:Dolichyl-phosphate-mannose-protein mannosyltransferase
MRSFLFRFNPLPLAFFTLLLLTGIFIYRDYGLSFDEEIERITGLVTFKYLLQTFSPGIIPQVNWLQNIPDLKTYQDRHYSPLFHLLCIFTKIIFQVKGSRETYFLTHLINFLVFCAGCFFFYKIIKHRYKQEGMALVGTLFLVLSPRIFADAFYNSKDIVFMSACIIATYSCMQFLRHKNTKYLVIHALASAISIDIRFMGLIFPAVTIGYLVLDAIVLRQPASYKRLAALLLGYAGLTIAFTILFWPYLWTNPVGHFLSIFDRLDRQGLVMLDLYRGQLIPYNQLPWHYTLVWIAITTPVLYTLLFMAGLFFIGRALLTRHFYRQPDTRHDLLFAMLFFAPLLAVMLTKAILYDGWRHLFFIYPYFLLIAVRGTWELYQALPAVRPGISKPVKACLILILTFHVAFITVKMIRMHPFQHVYFNALVNKQHMEQKFDLDYWGLSYRQALEFLLKTDKSPLIKYNANNFPGRLNKEIMPDQERSRVQAVPLEQATYFLTEYRCHPQPYPYAREVYTIRVDGMKIMSVFKIK